MHCRYILVSDLYFNFSAVFQKSIHFHNFNEVKFINFFKLFVPSGFYPRKLCLYQSFAEIVPFILSCIVRNWQHFISHIFVPNLIACLLLADFLTRRSWVFFPLPSLHLPSFISFLFHIILYTTAQTWKQVLQTLGKLTKAQHSSNTLVSSHTRMHRHRHTHDMKSPGAGNKGLKASMMQLWLEWEGGGDQSTSDPIIWNFRALTITGKKVSDIYIYLSLFSSISIYV